MVAYRKLSSGKWQAAVSLPYRLPSGKQRRVTKTHPLKGVVRDWATKLEAEIAAGTWKDPRSGDATLSIWYAEWQAGRVAAGSTQRKDDSHWRVHVEPRWGGHPLNTITTRDLRLWVAEMHERQCRWCRACPQVNGQRLMSPHRGQPGESTCQGTAHPPGLPGPTVRGAVTTLSSVLHAAVRSGLLAVNPAAGLQLPRVDAKPVFWWTRDEADKILAQLQGGTRLMVDLDFHCGLRLGELLGLKRKYVEDSEGRLLIHVVGVQTRDGYREYPKSRMSRRSIPVPTALTATLGEHMTGLDPEDIVFSSPGGSAWDDRNWARRVFGPAIVDAGVRRGTPHDMRHTAASWLVQAGVDLYLVQALLGHESFSTTQRYAHLAPDSFDRVMTAWDSMQ